MPGLKFSVPYNNHFETLEKLSDSYGKGINNNKIEEVYLSAPQKVFGSGRVVKRIDENHLEKVIDFCHENGWKVNVAFNSTCGGTRWYKRSFVSKFIDSVKKFYKMGMDSIILANPHYIKKVSKELGGLDIMASSFCDIHTVERAEYYERLGVTAFVPWGIGKDLERLKKIKEATDLTIRLMVNEGCLWRCPYRYAHANFSSHASKGEESTEDFSTNECVRDRIENPSKILKSEWIRPEDLSKYEDITCHFKIVGRTMSSKWITKVVGHYLKESYEGNLLEIIAGAIPKYLQVKDAEINNKKLGEFIDKLYSCDGNCSECDYCQEIAKEVLEFG